MSYDAKREARRAERAKKAKKKAKKAKKTTGEEVVNVKTGQAEKQNQGLSEVRLPLGDSL